jgi:hypothetical protein
MKQAGLVARMGVMRNANRVLARKPEGKRPLGRSRHRREVVRTVLKEIGRKGVKMITLNQDRHRWRSF